MKKQRVVLTIVCMLVVLLLGGCTTAEESERIEGREVAIQRLGAIDGSGIYRIVDQNAEVVCWVQFRGGLDCLPFSQLSPSARER